MRSAVQRPAWSSAFHWHSTARRSRTLRSERSAAKRGQTGSMTFLFMAQILSHSCTVTLRDAPCRSMNSRSADSCMPRRNTPWRAPYHTCSSGVVRCRNMNARSADSYMPRHDILSTGVLPHMPQNLGAWQGKAPKDMMHAGSAQLIIHAPAAHTPGQLASMCRGPHAGGGHLHGGEARVIPAARAPGVHKPGQLALGQHGVDEQQAGEVEDVHARQARPHLRSQQRLTAAASAKRPSTAFVPQVARLLGTMDGYKPFMQSISLSEQTGFPPELHDPRLHM